MMTNFLLLIGAGLFAKATAGFQKHAFQTLLGADADDAAGTGPGSYRVQGNVWHLDCCSGNGWSIFGALFGWSNDATSRFPLFCDLAPSPSPTATLTVGSVLSYVFYWLAVIAVLIYMKYSEVKFDLVVQSSTLTP